MNANGNDPGLTAKAAKPLASELIWEVEGIAAELGLPTRVVYNLLRTQARLTRAAARLRRRHGHRRAPSMTTFRSEWR